MGTATAPSRIPGAVSRARRTPTVLRVLGSTAFLRLFSVGAVLLVWQVLGEARPAFVSYPTAIVRSLADILWPTIVPAFGSTILGMAVGFAIAAPAGMLLGFLIARSRLLDILLTPYVNAIYATPRYALIPLLVIWLGIDFQLRVAMVVVSAIFPIIVNTYAGAREVDRELLDVGRVFTASKRQVLRTIVVPGSLPFVFAGLRIGLARAIGGIVSAEMTATVAGLGSLLIIYGKYIQPAPLFASLVSLGVLSIILTAILVIVQRRVMPWAQKERLL